MKNILILAVLLTGLFTTAQVDLKFDRPIIQTLNAPGQSFSNQVLFSGTTDENINLLGSGFGSYFHAYTVPTGKVLKLETVSARSTAGNYRLFIYTPSTGSYTQIIFSSSTIQQIIWLNEGDKIIAHNNDSNANFTSAFQFNGILFNKIP